MSAPAITVQGAGIAGFSSAVLATLLMMRPSAVLTNAQWMTLEPFSDCASRRGGRRSNLNELGR